MEMQKNLDRVTVIIVGVQNYNQLKKLKGTRSDVERMREIFVSNSRIALLKPNQVITLFDCDTELFRNQMNDYINSRSAVNDILIFYFSGHGASLNSNDFAFCFKDARVHEGSGFILPLSIIRFSSIVHSLKAVNVIPLFIIDSCLSGKTGEFLIRNLNETKENMRLISNAFFGSNYALFCSCSGSEVSREDNDGGFFSSSLYEIANSGKKTSKLSESTLSINNIYPLVLRAMEIKDIDYSPLLFLGDTFQSFPLIKNIGYKQGHFSFTPAMKKLLLYLWNDGEPIEIEIRDLLNFGTGVYANHRKLSYKVWDILCTTSEGKRKLTKKGENFVQGKVKIPKTIIPFSKSKYVEKPQSRYISINDV